MSETETAQSAQTAQSHSPLPWRIEARSGHARDGDRDVIVSDHGDRVAVVSRNGVASSDEASANARRIVACVNKCAELETTDLENPDNGLLLSKQGVYRLVPEDEYHALQQELVGLRPLPRQAGADLDKYLSVLESKEQIIGVQEFVIGYLKAFAKSVSVIANKHLHPSPPLSNAHAYKAVGLSTLASAAEDILATTIFTGEVLTVELINEAHRRYDQAIRNATSDKERESLEREGFHPFLAECALGKTESEVQNA